MMNTGEMQKKTIYLDMDGVIADFDRFSLNTLGRRFDSFPTSQSAWDAMQAHLDVYMRLEPMPDARELVNGVFKLKESYGFRVAVLTAIPKIGRIPDARQHKMWWILRHFPELASDFNIGPHAEHKQYHCRAGDVLIDDSELNIPQWNSRNGLGILHTSARDSLVRLERYLHSSASPV